MIPRISIFIFFLASIPCLNVSIAQTNFLKGYIVTLDSDTLPGEIDNRSYLNNSQFCDFRETGSQTIIRYLPKQIAGYKFADGKYYVSHEIQGIPVFLEYLINGKLDIYFWKDDFGADHYYVVSDTLIFRELKYGKYEKLVDGKRTLYNITQYRGLLKNYMADCPEIQQKVSTMNEPNHKNLINIAEEYHNLTCQDQQCIVYEKKMSHKIKMAFSTGEIYFLNTEARFATGWGWHPIIGGDLLFQQTQKSENLYIGIGFYTTGKIKDESRNSEFLALDKFFIRIPLSINYISAKQGISPYLGYEFDLNRFLGTQALKVGMNYLKNNYSILLIGEIETASVVFPYAYSFKVGMCFDLR